MKNINNYKNYIIEIQPIKGELDIINEVIKYYKIKIDNLKIEKINKIKEIENSLKNKKMKEEKLIKEKIKTNQKNKETQIKLNNNIFINDINEIKRKYEKEIKLRKNQYERDYNNIINKFKLINEKDYIIHKYKINNLDKQYVNDINNLKYDIIIENTDNLKIINEKIYNTFNLYNNNYYNELNINNLLFSYFRNDYINDIMKKTLKNKYGEISKIILQKRNEDLNFNLKKENKQKILEEKINCIAKEYESNTKKTKEMNEKQNKINENNLKKLKEENEMTKIIINKKCGKGIFEINDDLMEDKLKQGIKNIIGFSLGSFIPIDYTASFSIAKANRNIYALFLGINDINIKDRKLPEEEEEEDEIDIDISDLFKN